MQSKGDENYQTRLLSNSTLHFCKNRTFIGPRKKDCLLWLRELKSHDQFYYTPCLFVFKREYILVFAFRQRTFEIWEVINNSGFPTSVTNCSKTWLQTNIHQSFFKSRTFKQVIILVFVTKFLIFFISIKKKYEN